MIKDYGYAIVAGFFLCAILNTMPFADAEKYRRAKSECEKTLPRNQHCTVIGIPQPNNEPK